MCLFPYSPHNSFCAPTTPCATRKLFPAQLRALQYCLVHRLSLLVHPFFALLSLLFTHRFASFSHLPTWYRLLIMSPFYSSHTVPLMYVSDSFWPFHSSHYLPVCLPNQCSLEGLPAVFLPSI